MRQPLFSTIDALASLLNGGAVIKWVATMLGALAGYFLPSEDLRKLAICTFAMVIFDTISGMLAAGREGDPIQSRKFGRVIAKLIAYPIAVMTATMVVDVIPGAGQLYPVAAAAALALIFATEALSVIENLDRLGVPLPSFVRTAISKFRDEKQPKETKTDEAP